MGMIGIGAMEGMEGMTGIGGITRIGGTPDVYPGGADGVDETGASERVGRAGLRLALRNASTGALC